MSFNIYKLPKLQPGFTGFPSLEVTTVLRKRRFTGSTSEASYDSPFWGARWLELEYLRWFQDLSGAERWHVMAFTWIYINQSDHFNWWSDLSQQIMMTIQHADSYYRHGESSRRCRSRSPFCFSSFFNSMISSKRSQLLEIQKRPEDIPRRNASQVTSIMEIRM